MIRDLHLNLNQYIWIFNIANLKFLEYKDKPTKFGIDFYAAKLSKL